MIIITGSSGFVGRNLTAYFEVNHISPVSNLNLRQPLPLRLQAADAIIHLAGMAHDLQQIATENDYYEINYGKTKELFDLFLKSDVKDFVYFSSVKAAADIVTDVMYEDVLPDPKTFYGRSKLKAEQYLLNHPLPAGKRVIVLRPCMIHGRGNKGNLNLLYKLIKKRIPYPLAAFDNMRSYLSIPNLNYIIEQILNNRSIQGGVYNVADDEPLSTTEVIRIISEGLQQKPMLWKANASLITFFARVGDSLHLPLNSERLKKLTESYVVSNDKLKSALNITVLPVSSRQGLLATIRSFRVK
jgi:nucleoside-diphosphate-sugar epimerase